MVLNLPLNYTCEKFLYTGSKEGIRTRITGSPCLFCFMFLVSVIMCFTLIKTNLHLHLPLLPFLTSIWMRFNLYHKVCISVSRCSKRDMKPLYQHCAGKVTRWYSHSEIEQFSPLLVKSEILNSVLLWPLHQIKGQCQLQNLHGWSALVWVVWLSFTEPWGTIMVGQTSSGE